MIIITGGAGMIGSVIASQLNQNPHTGQQDLLIVDRLLHDSQWQNMVKRRRISYVDKDDLWAWLESSHADEVQAVIHMGAISTTVETDFNQLLASNVYYSQDLWQWCAAHDVPFLYASSAATYGDGTQGYSDAHATLDRLRPLNAYGYSKHLFDQWVLAQSQAGKPTPPAWVGFKFFNVYGPNEYHKGRMASMVWQAVQQLQTQGEVSLFKSDRAGIADGEQQRDFVYVHDAARLVLWFLNRIWQGMHRQQDNGIYNAGTGKARSFNALVSAVINSMRPEAKIRYIDMPPDLHGKYQYFTQADMGKVLFLGFDSFTALEDGVADYVQNYLLKVDPYC